MLSLRDPYFRSLYFSDIYFFEFFPWYHNSLAINITTHHNRWKSEMCAVTKVAFALGLVTTTFSLSNNWHKHISHLKPAEPSKWPYKLNKEKQKSIPNSVPELVERFFRNWSRNTCLSCKYCRLRCLGCRPERSFLASNLAMGNPISFAVKRGSRTDSTL